MSLNLNGREVKAENLSIGQPPLPDVRRGPDISERLTLASITRKVKRWVSAYELHSSYTQVEDIFPELPTRLLLLGKHKVSL